MLAIAAEKRWNVYQLDVKSAFLIGVLHKELYVQQPEGFVKPSEEDNDMYGLMQAPRVGYTRIMNTC